jgi:transcriptional regulator with GAF, ATPase, and Fis domain
MTRQIQLKKPGKEIGEKIDFLREITTALLDEVKALVPLKELKFEKEIDLDEEVKKFEIYLIERALEKTGGSQIEAARLLKLKHTTLNAKIKRYEICLRNLYRKTALNKAE